MIQYPLGTKPDPELARFFSWDTGSGSGLFEGYQIFQTLGFSEFGFRIRHECVSTILCRIFQKIFTYNSILTEYRVQSGLSIWSKFSKSRIWPVYLNIRVRCPVFQNIRSLVFILQYHSHLSVFYSIHSFILSSYFAHSRPVCPCCPSSAGAPAPMCASSAV